MTLINKIPIDAPLWQGAPLEKLLKIIERLSSASYHYADDSGKEWKLAREAVAEAASVANELKLSFSACENLYKHSIQLVSFEQFMDAILKDLRK